MPLELPNGWVSVPAPKGLGLTAKWEAVKNARLPPQYSAPNSDDAVALARRTIKYAQEPTSTDNWLDPNETLHLGAGDCEDWCLFVRALLLNGGIVPEKLWLLIVNDLTLPRARQAHALLWTPIRYCDVRAPRPLSHAVFSDYTPIAAFRTDHYAVTEAVTFGRRR